MFKEFKITKSWFIYICDDWYSYDWKVLFPCIQVRHKEYKTYEVDLSWWSWAIRATIYKELKKEKEEI